MRFSPGRPSQIVPAVEKAQQYRSEAAPVCGCILRFPRSEVLRERYAKQESCAPPLLPCACLCSQPAAAPLPVIGLRSFSGFRVSLYRIAPQKSMPGGPSRRFFRLLFPSPRKLSVRPLRFRRDPCKPGRAPVPGSIARIRTKGPSLCAGRPTRQGFRSSRTHRSCPAARPFSLRYKPPRPHHPGRCAPE